MVVGSKRGVYDGTALAGRRTYDERVGRGRRQASSKGRQSVVYTKHQGFGEIVANNVGGGEGGEEGGEGRTPKGQREEERSEGACLFLTRQQQKSPVKEKKEKGRRQQYVVPGSTTRHTNVLERSGDADIHYEQQQRQQQQQQPQQPQQPQTTPAPTALVPVAIGPFLRSSAGAQLVDVAKGTSCRVQHPQTELPLSTPMVQYDVGEIRLWSTKRCQPGPGRRRVT